MRKLVAADVHMVLRVEKNVGPLNVQNEMTCSVLSPSSNGSPSGLNPREPNRNFSVYSLSLCKIRYASIVRKQHYISS